MPFAIIQRGRIHEIVADATLGNLLDLVDLADHTPVPEVGWSFDGTAFAPPAPPAPLTADDLRAYAAAARYMKETGGITVGNAPIATDRDSQDRITGLWAAAQIDPAISVQFKSAGGGFVTLVAGQIKAIAAAVVAHVQACFAAEAQVDDAIAAGTVTTTAQIDQVFAAVTA